MKKINDLKPLLLKVKSCKFSNFQSHLLYLK